MDYTYAGLVGRSVASTDHVDLEAVLGAASQSRRLRFDGASFPWVVARVRAWSKVAGVELLPLPKVAGLPVSDGDPVMVSVPDRAGRQPPSSWRPEVPATTVEHRFAGNGELAAITVVQTDAGEAFDISPPVAARGHDLARRIRQIPRVEPVFTVHGSWCVYRQPAATGGVLSGMAELGIAGGDAVDLPELAGGIAAIVPGSATDADLAAYAAALEQALR